jgi:integrase/recombinase XerD
MGQLRDRMEQDLKLKGVSPATIRNYLLYCRKFAAFYMRSPEELGASEIRAFLLHQIEVEQLAYASYRQGSFSSSLRRGTHDPVQLI